MANISFIVKQKLESAIKILCRDFSSHVKRPGKDFSRNRKLPFEEVIRFLLPLQGQCMDQELFRHFSKKPLFFSTDYSGIPHSSAMIQARQKLSDSAMPALFHSFTETCKKGALFQGYQLLAIDGSQFSVPENLKEPLCWRKIPNISKGRNVIHLNAMYHLQSGIFEDVVFQPICECNEHKALTQMVDRRSSAFPAIFMADRGYESYNTFAHIEQKGDKYVVRGRESGTGICSSLNLPDTEEYDIEKELYICKKHSKKVKTNPRKYKRIRSDATFDFFTDDCEKYRLNLRIVKIKLSETTTEVLFTNLSKEEFSADDLKRLYHMRWGIETAFDQLKYALGAASVHSKNSELIIQELYGKLIMFNFCKTIVGGIAVKQQEYWKYEYKLNIKMAMCICREFWCSQTLAAPEVEKMLLNYLVPIRDNRTFPRDTVKKSAIAFNSRIA